VNFQDVWNDITKLKGSTLQGITPRVPITILDVTNAGITVLPVTGKPTFWAIEKFEVLWEALNTKPAIHVDSELHGGSSSRNQPETILKNLPYIKVVYIDRRKHLALDL